MNTHLSYTANYSYIDCALRARWEGFCALEKAMMGFVPKPPCDFVERREDEFVRVRQLNQGASEQQIIALVNGQMDALTSYQFQLHDRFDEPLMNEYVTVTMLSHAYCEAIINAIIAVRLADLNSSELFPIFERAEFIQKWTVAPKCFAPEYEFPRGTALYETLKKLTTQRNALVHHKVGVQIGGAEVLQGSVFERRPLLEEALWMRRFFSLPYDLADLVDSQAPGGSFVYIEDRSPIEVASIHVAQ